MKTQKHSKSFSFCFFIHYCIKLYWVYINVHQLSPLRKVVFSKSTKRGKAFFCYLWTCFDRSTIEVQPYNECYINILFTFSLGLMSARGPLWLSWRHSKMETLLITWKILTLQQDWKHLLNLIISCEASYNLQFD